VTPAPSTFPVPAPTRNSISKANSWDYIFQTIELYLIPFGVQLLLFELFRGKQHIFESRRDLYNERQAVGGQPAHQVWHQVRDGYAPICRHNTPRHTPPHATPHAHCAINKICTIRVVCPPSFPAPTL
jgi:hypothetical protein